MYKNRLKHFRLKTGLSQAGFAKLLAHPMKQQNYARLETGRGTGRLESGHDVLPLSATAQEIVDLLNAKLEGKHSKLEVSDVFPGLTKAWAKRGGEKGGRHVTAATTAAADAPVDPT